MATLAAVLAATHHPFYLKATSAPPEEQIPQAPKWKRKVEAYRETLTRARPDILVMVGADHFHQFFLDNYPTFLIGKAPRSLHSSWSVKAGVYSHLGQACRLSRPPLEGPAAERF